MERDLALTKSPSAGLKQVMMARAGLERKLLTSPEKMDAGNLELREFPDRGVLVELVVKEMKDRIGHINYISYHGVEKPRSTPTSGDQQLGRQLQPGSPRHLDPDLGLAPKDQEDEDWPGTNDS